MKILITGYKGFIGQNIVNQFSNDHDLSFFEWGSPYPEVKGLDWVIHLGAISSTTETNVEKVMKQNYDFSRWILHQCLMHGVNLQYASSASVYGLESEFTETSPLCPVSPYAWSKYLFDRYFLEHEWGQITVQGFRYFNVYGPHEDHKGAQASPYHKFTQQAKEKGVITLFEGSENFFRDFVPVETVVSIHRKFLEVKESGIFNVGTGEIKSFKQVAEEIAVKHCARLEYIPMPEEIRRHYQTYTKADISKLRKYYKS